MNGLPRVDTKEQIVGVAADQTPVNNALLASSFETGRVNLPILVRSSTQLEKEFGRLDYGKLEKFGYGKLAAKTWLDGGNAVWVVRNSFYEEGSDDNDQYANVVIKPSTLGNKDGDTGEDVYEAAKTISTKESQISGNKEDAIVDVIKAAGEEAATDIVIAASAPGTPANNYEIHLTPFNKFNRFGEDDSQLVDELLIKLNNYAITTHSGGSYTKDEEELEEIVSFVEDNNIMAPYMVTMSVIEVIGNSTTTLFTIDGSFDETLISPLTGSDLSLKSQLVNRQVCVEGKTPSLENMIEWIVKNMWDSNQSYALTSNGTASGLPIVMDENNKRIRTGKGFVVEAKAAIVNAHFDVAYGADLATDFKKREFMLDSVSYSLVYDFTDGSYSYVEAPDGTEPTNRKDVQFINISGNKSVLKVGDTVFMDFERVVYENGFRKIATSSSAFTSKYKLSNGKTHSMANLVDGWNLLTNKSKYPAKIALLPTSNNGAKLQATGTILAKRQDLLFLTQSGSLKQTQTQDVTTIVNSESYSYNNSFVASYVDWIDYPAPTGRKVRVPAVLNAIAAVSRLLKNNLWYQAPAGEPNGAILGRGILELDPDALGDIYNASLNPIYDSYIWGQKTLERANTAVSRITGRMTVNEIKRIIEATMRPYLFNDRNDERTRSRVVSELNVNFDEVVSSGAASINVVCNESLNTADVIDNKTLRLVVYATIVDPIEYVDATVVALTVSAGNGIIDISE